VYVYVAGRDGGMFACNRVFEVAMGRSSAHQFEIALSRKAILALTAVS
jgi:hypothetical protein